MTAPDIAQLSRFANHLADTARPITLTYFRGRMAVETKDDASPVTEADRETESALRAMIGDRFPDHGIYGEEHGVTSSDSPYTWVLDPIDGTKSFITGMPLFGTLIALLHQGRPLLGIIEMPALGERWIGIRGQGSQFNRQRCRVSDCRDLRQTRLYTTSPSMFNANDMPRFQTLARGVALQRFGGDCYSYGLLASGHVDLVVEADLAPYDFMALIPVVENAGGVISDWRGKQLSLESDGRVVAAATPALHEQALEILQ